MRALRRLLVFAGIAIALAACGGNEEETFSPLDPGDPGPIHVHGLGINPEDGSLFIATHTGLFRVGKEERKATRVGELYQDTMGFTVVGPNTFLGSGHPDLREAQEKDLPSLLGLIESNDAGETWEPISLLGEADFHALRFIGERVYGFDATNNRLMISTDGGDSWDERRPPGPLVDFAVDPDSPTHIIASSELGLLDSSDEGETWRPLFDAAGLLAWPSAQRFYLVTVGGQVFTSEDAGANWEHVGQIGGEPAALLATNAQELYVALHDGTIKQSRDSGVSWIVRSTP